MAVPRPIPRLKLCSGACANGTAGFDFGTIALLQNGGGHYAHAEREEEGSAALGGECSNASSFPVDTSSERFKGLTAGPAAAKTADACAAACCRLGAKGCTLWQLSATYKPPCWLGHPTRSEGTPPKDLVSRALTAPHPAPAPPHPKPRPPPPPPANYSVTFKGREFLLPADSLTIVAANGTVLFNTREVTCPTLQRVNTVATKQPLAWRCWSEKDALLNATSARPGATVTSAQPQEQLSLTTGRGKTIDLTEYLLYSAEVPASHFDADGGPTVLEISSMLANAFVPFVDGVQQPEVYDATHGQGAKRMSTKLTLPARTFGSGSGSGSGSATVRLSLLSVSLGIMSHVHRIDYKGIVGGSSAPLDAARGGIVTLGGADISSPAGGWTHTIGWAGETNGATSGSSSLPWGACPSAAADNALSWRKAEFSLARPEGEDFSVLLDASGMTRGHFYLNGHE